MSYRRNEQFLLASKKYYRTCRGANTCSPCGSNRDKCGDSYNNSVCEENGPKTIIDILCTLINERLQVTTPFGVITGTLLDVKKDYIVILEDTGAQVLVRTAKIESVSPIT